MRTRRFFLLSGLAALNLLVLTAFSVEPPEELFNEDFESPDVVAYTQGTVPPRWVRATQGYHASYHGLTDKASGDFDAPDPNHQAIAFRYTNSGVTTDEGVIGPFFIPTVYTVEFDVVADSGSSTTGLSYTVQFIAFADGVLRNDCRSTPPGSTVLKQTGGSANPDGSFKHVSFDYTPDPVGDVSEVDKDLGIRIKGSTTCATIDNVVVWWIPPPPKGMVFMIK